MESIHATSNRDRVAQVIGRAHCHAAMPFTSRFRDSEDARSPASGSPARATFARRRSFAQCVCSLAPAMFACCELCWCVYVPLALRHLIRFKDAHFSILAGTEFATFRLKMGIQKGTSQTQASRATKRNSRESSQNASSSTRTNSAQIHALGGSRQRGE